MSLASYHSPNIVWRCHELRPMLGETVQAGGPVVGEPVRSVLHDVQEAAGAAFKDEYGWLWTESIGSALAAYEAVRDGMAIWDLYPLVKWEISGSDASAAIQRVFTADLGHVRQAAVKYGAFVDVNGLMIDEGTVFKHSDSHFWMCTNAEETGEHLRDHAPGLDVTVTNRTLDMPLISAQGPRSREVLQSLTKADLSAMRYYTFLPERVSIAGVPTWLMRTGFSGELGFELIPPPAGAVALWSALQEAGGVPFSLTPLEPVRVEAGLIIYDSDYSAGVDSPYDVSLDRYVHLDADVNFLGKNALRQLAAAPPRRLKTLRISGDQLPEPGADVLVDGVVVGKVTSPAASPRMGLLALAKLETGHAVDGDPVEVALADGTATATVDVLSVKDPRKLRPRS
jgi:aminomethyltransferase